MATPQQLLTEAQAAYHSLQTGTQARVVVEMDGSRVEFAPANLSKLYSYIQDLQRQVAVSTGVTQCLPGPATFYF